MKEEHKRRKKTMMILRRTKKSWRAEIRGIEKKE